MLKDTTSATSDKGKERAQPAAIRQPPDSAKLRFKFANGWVLEALFGSTEKLPAVYSSIRSVLLVHEPIVLLNPLPRAPKLLETSSATLKDLQLTPCASLRIEFENDELNSKYWLSFSLPRLVLMTPDLNFAGITPPTFDPFPYRFCV